jgi:alpha-glucosidase
MSQPPWWQTGIIYEIFPPSFMDSNGDGVGDLNGIISKLDYLAWLDVDALWIGPVYPSPMADFGYDISDYTGIHPTYGTLDDFDALLSEAHRRGLRVILDLVPNHSSDLHPWFQASRSSRDNPKRDWYVWKDPDPDGGPPNNWLSIFGGSAWTWDEGTGQYYYHTFAREEPDLNWQNPDVQHAVLDVFRFWLDRGVDGFRVDAIWYLVNDSLFRDNPLNPDYSPDGPRHKRVTPAFTEDLPEGHRIIRSFRNVIDEYEDRLLIGELYLPPEELKAYYGSADELHLPNNLQLLLTEWSATKLNDLICRYEGALAPDAWPNWVLSNHDQPRIATRAGAAQTRVAAMLLLTLRGTPFIYYGDEIGMPDGELPGDQLYDPQMYNFSEGGSRMPYRIPMRWTDEACAGFTAGVPWLPMAELPGDVSVEAQMKDEGSILNLYRRLITLRRSEPALSMGDFIPLYGSGDLLIYLRRAEASTLLVALNLGSDEVRFESARLQILGEVAAGTMRAREGTRVENDILLFGNEGIVVRLE